MTRLVPLGKVAAINPNTTISIGPDDLCSFVPMEVVDEATAEIIRLPTRPYKEVAKGYTSFAENDILFSKDYSVHGERKVRDSPRPSKWHRVRVD